MPALGFKRVNDVTFIRFISVGWVVYFLCFESLKIPKIFNIGPELPILLGKNIYKRKKKGRIWRVTTDIYVILFAYILEGN